MNLNKKQQKYLLNKYKFWAYGRNHSMLMIDDNCDVYRIDQTDHTSLHPLTNEEVSLLLALSPDSEINQTIYSETTRLYSYEPTY